MIQTKLKKTVDAYNALMRLSGQPFRFSDARKIMRMMKAMQDEVDFWNQETQKLLSRYACKLHGNDLVFEMTEDRDAFDSAWLALEDQDVEIALDKIVIHESDYGEHQTIMISPDDLIALENILEIAD